VSSAWGFIFITFLAPQYFEVLLHFGEVPVSLLLTTVRPINLDNRAWNYKLILKHVTFHAMQQCYSVSVFYTALANYNFCVISHLFTVYLPSSRRMRWAGHVARMGERRAVYGVLVGNPEAKRPLGRARRKWEDNIKVGWGMDWIELAQDRDIWRALVNAVMNHRVP
jgi:hypothetical protein